LHVESIEVVVGVDPVEGSIAVQSCECRPENGKFFAPIVPYNLDVKPHFGEVGAEGNFGYVDVLDLLRKVFKYSKVVDLTAPILAPAKVFHRETWRARQGDI
jgi:hypothetical protein